MLEKPIILNKLDKLETTTVWIFSAEDFEERLNKNVIDRYSNGDDYLTITFNYHTNMNIMSTEGKKQEKIKLLFIKSPFLSNNPSHSDIDYYLKVLKNIVIQDLPNMEKGGFVVIQT